MLTCREATTLISQSIDDRLPVGRRVALRLHLIMCKLCSRYKRQLVFLGSAIRKYAGKIEDGRLFPAFLTEESRRHLTSLISRAK